MAKISQRSTTDQILVKTALLVAGGYLVKSLFFDRRIRNQNIGNLKKEESRKSVNHSAGGSAAGVDINERNISFLPQDEVDEASFESFPASDPPAW